VLPGAHNCKSEIGNFVCHSTKKIFFPLANI
jgi:hypothetical protein